MRETPSPAISIILGKVENEQDREGCMCMCVYGIRLG